MLRTLLVEVLMEAAAGVPPGGAPPDGGAAAAAGAGADAGAGAGAGAGGGEFFRQLQSMLPLILLICLIWWVLVFRPDGKNRQRREQLLANLKKGDTVRLTSGLIGKLWRVDAGEVVVVIDKDRDVKARFTKDAVADLVRVEPKDGGSGKAEAEAPAAPQTEKNRS